MEADTQRQTDLQKTGENSASDSNMANRASGSSDDPAAEYMEERKESVANSDRVYKFEHVSDQVKIRMSDSCY